jgi:hypothetical protein
MKRTQALFVLLILTALLTNSYAQRINIVSGSLSGLKGEKAVSVEFVYDHMKVGNEDEKAYLKRKTDDYNKKEPGRGDTWAQAWVSDRQAKYEPSFFELFTKVSNISSGSGKYKIIFHTERTEPGFNVFVTKKPAAIDATLTIIEVATGKEVAKVTIDNALGRTFGMSDLDTGVRIQECYAMAGKAFAKFLMKQ